MIVENSNKLPSKLPSFRKRSPSQNYDCWPLSVPIRTTTTV